jgi:hypothetical protein
LNGGANNDCAGLDVVCSITEVGFFPHFHLFNNILSSTCGREAHRCFFFFCFFFLLLLFSSASFFFLIRLEVWFENLDESERFIEETNIKLTERTFVSGGF